MNNKLFNDRIGSYDNIKVHFTLFGKLRAMINSFLWRIRNKKKFMRYAKELRKNYITSSILLK